MLWRVRVFLGDGAVARHGFAAGEPVPGTGRENSYQVLSVHQEQPANVPVPGPQGPRVGDGVQPDTVHAHVLHHARVPGGRRPAVAGRNRQTAAAPVRLQRDNHRLGTRLRVAVHAGRGQHTHSGPNHGPPDKRDPGK